MKIQTRKEIRLFQWWRGTNKDVECSQWVILTLWDLTNKGPFAIRLCSINTNQTLRSCRASPFSPLPISIQRTTKIYPNIVFPLLCMRTHTESEIVLTDQVSIEKPGVHFRKPGPLWSVNDQYPQDPSDDGKCLKCPKMHWLGVTPKWFSSVVIASEGLWQSTKDWRSLSTWVL